MREDRLSLLEQDGLDEGRALANEFEHGLRSLAEGQAGLERFRSGAGRHGSFDTSERLVEKPAVRSVSRPPCRLSD